MPESSWNDTEQRALSIGKWSNLLMGLAGVLAAWLSHSQALLVDGLFSMIGFAAAVVGARVSASTQLVPDKTRPLGYAADESIYATFRALSLLGLVAFAAGSAVLNIVNYAGGGEIPALRYGPILVYFIVIGTVCFGLAANHHFAWKRTGKRNNVLRLESKAALFNGTMTIAAGAGLLVMPFLRGGPLGWMTPIGDSLIVLLLCVIVVGRYYADFMAGLGELAGVSVPGKQVLLAQRSVLPAVKDCGGRLVDLSVLKIGRSFQVQVYFEPDEPISARAVDAITRRLDAALEDSLGPTTTVVIISRHGRVLGEETAGHETTA